MAAFKCLISQTGRRSPASPLVSLLRRHFSVDPLPSPNPESRTEPNANIRQPIPIQPVSYPTKPKPPPSEEIEHQHQPERQTSSLDSQDSGNREARSWTRDDMRYMKDGPAISPVSYASRVAPLPEDRVSVGDNEAGDEDRTGRNEGLERERRRIEDFRRRGAFTYGRREEEEDKNLPFPKLVKVENADQNSKKKGKVIYDLKEAIQLVKASAKKTFDETLEAHVRMTPDLQRTDLKLNSFVRLPHDFGKTHRVVVFAEGAAAEEARDAGADVVGGPELVENIRTGQLKVDFDNCISTLSMMEHVKKLSRHLKQLMPDTKKGTLTNEISRTVKLAKEPSVHFKKDKTAIVHVGLGKLSFSEDALRDNVGAFVNALLLAKPPGLKKSSKYAGYVDSFYICSTMGPSFSISIQSLSLAADRHNKSQMR